MTASVTTDQIRLRAYHLWEAEGRPAGRDQEYWFRAEQQFHPADTNGAAGKASATKRRAPARK